MAPFSPAAGRWCPLLKLQFPKEVLPEQHSLSTRRGGEGGCTGSPHPPVKPVPSKAVAWGGSGAASGDPWGQPKELRPCSSVDCIG